MGAGRRRPQWAAAAALGAVLAAAAAAGARAGAGYATLEGYAELPDPPACKVGCDTVTMSGLQLLHRWQKRPEGGVRWYRSRILRKTLLDLGQIHEARGRGVTREGARLWGWLTPS